MLYVLPAAASQLDVVLYGVALVFPACLTMWCVYRQAGAADVCPCVTGQQVE